MFPAIEILGYFAATLTTICWLPQAFKTIRTKDTKSLSLWTQCTFALGIGLWLVYGLVTGNGPLILANTITFVLVLTILSLKLRYG